MSYSTLYLHPFNLDPGRSSHLEEIVLEVGSVCRWSDKDGPLRTEVRAGEEDNEDKSEDEDCEVNHWRGLDAVLSKLAKAPISMRGERLLFSLVVLEGPNDGKLVSMVRKWLPKLLPQFSELGLLHVHYGQGSRGRAIDVRGW